MREIWVFVVWCMLLAPLCALAGTCNSTLVTLPQYVPKKKTRRAGGCGEWQRANQDTERVHPEAYLTAWPAGSLFQAWEEYTSPTRRGRQNYTAKAWDWALQVSPCHSRRGPGTHAPGTLVPSGSASTPRVGRFSW